MLPFRPLDITDKAVYDAHTGAFRTIDSSFAHQFFWRMFYDPEIAVTGGFLFRRFRVQRKWLYSFPLGEGDLRQAITAIKADAQAREIPCALAVSEPQKAILEELCPGTFSYTPDRNAADYLYLSEDLAELKGRKYHAKRNFAARFEREQAGNWRFDDLLPEHLPLVHGFLRRWCCKNDCASDPSLQEEAEAITHLLCHWSALNPLAGILFAGDKVAAFTVGVPISDDTLDILIEKADYEIMGSYQMINREFARRWREPYRYFNREDDMGLEGLRKAKLSYHPIDICMKYKACPVSE